MIIIEGCDKAGKTTLAHKIANKLQIPVTDVIKFGIPKGNPIPGYVEELKNPRPAIYDRFFYGEIPYSIVKNRFKYMSFLEFRILDLWVQTFPHYVIYLRPDRNEIIDRLKNQPDTYIDIAEAVKLYEEFDYIFEMSTSNVSCIHDPDNNFDVIMANVKKIFDPRSWRLYERWKEEGMPGVGTLEPSIVIVGERYNPRADYQVTFWSKSGEFLFRCLDRAKHNLHITHFTNAISRNMVPITEQQLKILSPRRIVCLGDVAYTNIRDIWPRRDIRKVPHPAYWSRFRSSDTEDYVKMLEDACTL